MADIRLINILPTQATQGVQQPQQISFGTGGSTVGTLASLASGSIISGFIINRDVSGNPVLRTEKGDISFETNFFLKIGSELVIRVENRAGNTLAHILTVNGQSPEVAETQSGFANEPDVIVGQRLGGDGQKPALQAPIQEAASGQTAATQAPRAESQTRPIITVTGILLTPPQSETPQPPPALPGTQLTLKIVSLVSAEPVPPSANAPTQQVPASYAAAYSKAAGALPANPAPIPTTLVQITPSPATQTALPVAQQPPVSPVATESVALSAPATVAPQSVAAQAVIPKPEVGQLITTTVTGREPSGETLVQTPVGIVRLQAGIALPPGSKVTFEITQIAQPATTQAALANASQTPAPLVTLARQWDTLQQIFQVLTGPDGPLRDGIESLFAPPSLVASSPQGQASVTPQSISAGLMFFMTALRGSDFRNWLGKNTVQWLEDRGHEALIRKGEAEFVTLARPFTQVEPHQWQTLFFPLAVAGEWQQARMFVKRDKRQPHPGKQSRDEDTRFVVEVELSQMGELQMDGFVRKQESKVEFDLFIRTHVPLHPQVQQDILNIYSQTGELTGYRGQLVFQAVKDFPVSPLEEVIAQGLNDLMA